MKLLKSKQFVYKLVFIMLVSLLLLGYFSLAEHARRYNRSIYDQSVELFEDGKYEEAVECLRQIPDYMQYRGVPELLHKYDIDFVCPKCGHLLTKD